MVNTKLLFLSTLLLAADVLAGTVKYHIGYRQDGETKIAKRTSELDDRLMQQVVNNIASWSRGRYKAVKGDRTGAAIIYNKNPAASANFIEATFRDMKEVIETNASLTSSDEFANKIESARPLFFEPILLVTENGYVKKGIFGLA
ncbi:hypothetical protein K461DRAFT_304668 [Myriangium duriaei CBS 260.36]|uniref:Uncharacterized protein n=1 Tax=Myriangium duriaei CBS 260.36 TaxID=1168546 RepID=A0A9P4J690_9PEZI|nr:hypothetical protein K461DRAFT_304668 [Myriangium duriaei CBS 260.36]